MVRSTADQSAGQKARSQLQCLPTPVKSILQCGQVRGDSLH